jgi:hypothetical protein
VNLENVLAELRSERVRIDQAISALRRPRRLTRSPSWPSAEVKSYPNNYASTSPYECIGPQADFRSNETALGKVEGKVCSQEG